ncbi:MAG: VanZ family protein [Erysipelotrichaceae bacterium]
MNIKLILELMLRAGIFSIVVVLLYQLILKYILKLKQQDTTKVRISKSLFLFYIAMLFYVTLYRDGINIENIFNTNVNTVNLVPLVNTFRMLPIDIGVFLYNLMGNILWFVPLGMALNSLYNKSFKESMIIVGMCSLGIEILQFIFNQGISDIDDIIFNVIGGFIGYIIYNIMSKNR